MRGTKGEKVEEEEERYNERNVIGRRGGEKGRGE